MLESAQNLIRRAGEQLKLNQEDINYLLKANAEHIFEIELSNGSTHKAFRVQHNNALGPYKGGVRFHPGVSLDEVRALATLMSLKTAAVGLPLGGGKGGVTIDPKQLSEAELEELSRKYVAHLSQHIGPDKDIPAPDMNTNATIMDWMADEFTKQTGESGQATFTGKSVEKGGSEGREQATGRGGVTALREVLAMLGKSKQSLTYAIQGFGNVGLHFGLLAEEMLSHLQLQAASDSSGGVSSAFGLSAKELADYKAKGQKLINYQTDDNAALPDEQILQEEVDILVLAAMEDVITEDNMQSIKAPIILELANGPISEAAYEYLAKQGKIIIPDVLANAGGVIVSYLEWLQNRQGEHWGEAKVNQQLEEYIVKAVKAAFDYSQEHNVTLKDAAIAIAIQRILANR